MRRVSIRLQSSFRHSFHAQVELHSPTRSRAHNKGYDAFEQQERTRRYPLYRWQLHVVFQGNHPFRRFEDLAVEGRRYRESYQGDFRGVIRPTEP